MPRFETPTSHCGLVGASPEQVETLFLSDTFKFIVGPDAKAFPLHPGLVSQVSKPLNTLINCGMRESREGCVTWEDVEVDIFVRFAQFLYTGSYARFEPKVLPPSPTDEATSLTAKVVENFIDHINPRNTKEPVIIDMTDDTVTTTTSTGITTTATAARAPPPPPPTQSISSIGGPSRPADTVGLMTDFDFDLFFSTPSLTPLPPPSAHNEKKDAFKLPYSLYSYKSAATDWISGRNHSTRCRRGQSSFVPPPSSSRYGARQAAKRKFEAISCDCDTSNEGTPSERKRDFISAFMAKESSSLGYDRTVLNQMLPDGGGGGKTVVALGSPLPVRRSFEPVFVGHARLWVFADRYAIMALMDLACGHLVHELSRWTMSGDSFGTDFGELVRYVYDNTVTGCQLRLLVAQFAACVVEDVSFMDEWVAMLNDVPDFSADLINQLMNRLA